MFKIDEYTKPNQYVLKYKHNHINGNDSFSTFDFKTINVKEKCILSSKWTNIIIIIIIIIIVIIITMKKKKKITTCLYPKSSQCHLYSSLKRRKYRDEVRKKLWESKELWK